jgi:hypothetical protein
MPDHAIVADRHVSGSRFPVWMHFPFFMFAVCLALVLVFSVLAGSLVALGFLIPAFFVCSVVALLNLAAIKFNRANNSR